MIVVFMCAMIDKLLFEIRFRMQAIEEQVRPLGRETHRKKSPTTSRLWQEGSMVTSSGNW